MAFVSALAILLWVLVLQSVYHLQLYLGTSLGFDGPSMAGRVALLALTFPLGVLIHEAGHCVAGLALGQRCRRFVIGPLEVADGWKIRLIPIRRAGMVDLVPSTFEGFRWQRAVIAVAGPFASLLGAIVFTSLAMICRTPFFYWFWTFCVQWALASLGELIPFRWGAARSDGYLLWEVARGGSAVDVLQRDTLVASSHATALRLRDWPEDLILRITEIPAQPAGRRYHFYLAYVHFLDRGNIETAQKYLEGMLADWSPSDPPEYALEAAFFLAFHGQDPDTARKWLALEARDAEPWVRGRAQAAVECATGCHEEAARLIGDALAAVRSASACGAHAYEIDLLEGMLAANNAPAVR